MQISKQPIDAFIEESSGIDFSSREALESWQLKMINEAIGRAKKQSGFYKAYPGHFSSLEAFKSAPFTYPSDLAQNNSKMLLSSQSEVSKVITSPTSATTQKAKRIFFDQSDLDRAVAFFKLGLSVFIGQGSKVLVIMPGIFRNGLCELICRALGHIPCHATPLPPPYAFEEAANALSEGCDYIVAMPSSLLSIARYARCFKTPISLKGALVSADTCTEAMGALLESELGCEIYPHYGSRESGLGGAITCKSHSGMHVRENELYVEILRPDGSNAAEGEAGEIVITTLLRKAMPLFRYRTGDLAYSLKARCSCGALAQRIGGVKRIVPKDEDIAGLGDIIFSYSETIDFMAKREGGKLFINALVSAPIDQKPLKGRLREAYGEIEISELIIDRGQKPFYESKRRM